MPETIYIVEKFGDTWQARFGVENMGHVEPVGCMTGTAGNANDAIEALERQADEQAARTERSRQHRQEQIDLLNRP